MKVNDVDDSGWNWAKKPFRKDPLTTRKICRDCWDGLHAPTENSENGLSVCKVYGCHCGCKDSIDEQRKERVAKTSNRKEQRKLMREMRDDPNNPLRAINTEYEKTHRPRYD